MHRRRRTALLATSAALLAAAPLLTGCGSQTHPGTAALVDGQRITVSELQGRVKEVRNALHEAIPNRTQYEQVVAQTGSISRTTLRTMVTDRVVHRLAVHAGVRTTRSEEQRELGELAKKAGSRQGLERTWLQQYGIPPERLEDDVRTNLEAKKLAAVYGIDLNSRSGQNAFRGRLVSEAKKLKVNVNPRYGTWDTGQNTLADVRTPWLRDVSRSSQQA